MDHVVAVPINWASLVALLIPVLTAVVAKYRQDTKVVHALIALVASGLLAVVSMLTTAGVHYTVQQVFASFLGVFIPAIASYLGFWQPVTDINRKAVPAKGI